jgi:methionyl-tRNA synthetase
MARYFVTTAIPYVNGRPHVGHALELVEADVLARHRRQRGDQVRCQTGTDDNALKNVRSAAEAGIPTATYVDRVSTRFAGLQQTLGLSFDDFIRTSSDPRHSPGVAKLWAACAESGDLYQKSYTGRYCVGCEAFYADGDLVDGRCPEHETPVEIVEETNWFFRLSRYQERLRVAVATDELRIEPATRKHEVLSFIESGLADFSVSRSVARARGWGIPVPGDPGQVVYVWFDALGNYITAPGYGTDDDGFDHWWTGSDERVHVIGKGIIRFHAVYWPAVLLSAGLRLPDTIFVHEYLTSGSRKISKSAGNADDPAEIAARFGVDALRWWLLRDVARAGDTDYTAERMVTRANEDLANNIGNLVNRTVSMVCRYRGGAIPAPGSARPPNGAADAIDQALANFDFRRLTEVIVTIGNAGNRYVETTRPWELARAERAGATRDALDHVLAELVAICRDLGSHLTPVLPAAARRILAQLGDGGDAVAPPSPIFPRLTVEKA